MRFLLDIKPKIRLQTGIIVSILGIIALYVLWNYETGFLGGFITGILLAVGFGLLVTYKKEK